MRDFDEGLSLQQSLAERIHYTVQVLSFTGLLIELSPLDCTPYLPPVVFTIVVNEINLFRLKVSLKFFSFTVHSVNYV